MTRTLDELWEKLRQYQIVEGIRPGIEISNTPWYIKFLLAASGWIAALFLIAFVAAVFSGVLKSSAAGLAFGLVVISLAFFALKRDEQGFYQHVGLACSLAGQAFVVYAIIRLLPNSFTAGALLVSGMQCLLFTVMRNYIHRLLCAFLGFMAFYVALNFSATADLHFAQASFSHAFTIALYALLVAWLWLNEFHLAQFYPATRAAAWGATATLISVGSFNVFQSGHFRRAAGNASMDYLHWLSEALLGLVLVWVVTQILKRQSGLESRVKYICILGVFALSMISLTAPGITLGLIIILLGYQQQNRVVLGLGFLALGAYVGRYYYVLEQTLAYKSAVLLICGTSLLLLRALLLWQSRTSQARTKVGQ